MNPNHRHHHHHHHHPMLKESLNRFFAQHRSGVTDFRDFTSIFSRMLHATPDPPIPLLWFYAALEFRAAPDPSRRARDLFQLLVSCSTTCGSTEKIAALAPLIFVLHRFALLRGEGELVKNETEGLVEGVVSYCSIFCGHEICHDDDRVVVSDFVDLIKVWMVDEAADCTVGDFFPYAGHEFRKGIFERGCDVGALAGVVMCQALLLKLCFAFQKGISRVEQEKMLMASAVQTITGFRTFRFLA